MQLLTSPGDEYAERAERVNSGVEMSRKPSYIRPSRAELIPPVSCDGCGHSNCGRRSLLLGASAAAASPSCVSTSPVWTVLFRSGLKSTHNAPYPRAAAPGFGKKDLSAKLREGVAV